MLQDRRKVLPASLHSWKNIDDLFFPKEKETSKFQSSFLSSVGSITKDFIMNGKPKAKLSLGC
jgi:hypothetical protein